MLDVLPIKLLTDEDSLIFGSLNVSLGKLLRAGIPVAPGLVVTAPELHLKTVLEHYDFGHIEKTPIPFKLLKEVGKNSDFLVEEEKVKSIKALWLKLLNLWLLEIKNRLWKNGFYPGLTENLEPKIVTFIKNPKVWGWAYFDPIQDDVVINTKVGSLHPHDLKKLDEMVVSANKKLFIPNQYEWILNGEIKLIKIAPFTPPNVIKDAIARLDESKWASLQHDKKTTVKVFLDLSTGFTAERQVDGVFIDSGKSFDDMLLRLVEAAATFPNSPVIFKLADKSEGMGKVRGALRLLHQKSLFDPLVEAVLFARSKKNLTNIHILLPFVRSVSEAIQLKRDLAVKKLMRKTSLQIWLELAVPENMINLEEYLAIGVDGVVINIDELLSHLSGFDHTDQTVSFYKQEVKGLIKFLDENLRILSKSKVPFIFYGSSSLNSEILELLVERGGSGIVVGRFEVGGIHELLQNSEKKMILRRAST